MPGSTTIAASHVLWPDASLAPGLVVVEGGRIAAVERAKGPVPERILAPGFVDLQVNGIDAVDVADADDDGWASLDAALLGQGTTTWCPTVITAPWDEMLGSVARIASAAQGDGPRPRVVGAHLEGPWLGGRRGAHASQLVVSPSSSALDDLPPGIALVTMGPEAEGAADTCRALVEQGIVVSLGHTAATFEVGRDMIEAGARLVTHLGNATGSISARSPGVFGLGLDDERVAVSVIADLVHVHPAVLRLVARSAEDRLVLVTDAVAWRSPSHEARRVALVDGAPRLADGTLAGTVLTMDGAIRNVVRTGAAPLVDALRAASTTPARVLGLSDRGEIRVGALADLVALTPDLQVAQVWIGGQVG